MSFFGAALTRGTTPSTADVAVADEVRRRHLDLQLAVARPDVDRLLYGGRERAWLRPGAEERLVLFAAVELDAQQRRLEFIRVLQPAADAFRHDSDRFIGIGAIVVDGLIP